MARLAVDQGMRVTAARGTIVSACWLAGLNLLTLARGFVVAGFLATSEYGVWGVLTAVIGTVIWLKDIGFGDRFIQQRDEDQEDAFLTFFSLEVTAAMALLAIMTIFLAVYAVVLGESRILLPGLVLALTLPGMALQAPTWIFYREMDYVRQRLLQSVDPVVGLVVTVGLAIAGLGVWSLVLGALAGCWAQAIVVVWASPYPIRFRKPTQVRDYLRFSWPLVVASGSGLLIAQVTVVAGEAAVGLAGLGAIALANNLTRYTGQVDKIVTDTLYPAICRIADRPALLYESFVKSNRLALLWGMPFGLGVTLFADDFVEFVIGEQWRPAVIVLQSLGVVTAVTQVGFNWTAYFRAVGRTVPFASVAIATLTAFLGVCVPLMFIDGLRGLAAGVLVMALVQLIGRVRELRKLFPEFRWWRQAARAVAPVVPAALLVLGARLLLTGEETALFAASTLLGYCVVVVVASLWLERRLLAEVLGYLRGRRPEIAQP